MTVINDIIEKWALKNAADYGKAEIGAVLAKVLSEAPEWKKKVKELIPKVNEIVGNINRLTPDQIAEQLKNYTFVEKKAEERKIVLPSHEGKVVTRYAPDPSGFPHIGHAKAALISYEAAKEYGGEMLLRIDDTDPRKVKGEYIEDIKNDMKWLGVSWSREFLASDFMEQLYDYGIELIKKGKAYVCECDLQTIKDYRRRRKECGDRGKVEKVNLQQFDKMMKGQFEEGQAILRFKGNMSSMNSIMRDPTLFRIVKAPHWKYEDKYAAWPSYYFYSPILDSEIGVTHAVRSKEYELGDELYYDILGVLELRKPIIVPIARLLIKNNITQKRVLRKLIEEKKVSGWDDPRLLTLAALRRRGILPEAIKAFVISLGVSKSESVPEIEQLLLENRKVLDPVAKRYNFVRNPVAVEIKKCSAKVAYIPFHPTEKMGEREVKVEGKVFIDGTDAKAIKEGEIVRLKDFCNIKILKKGKEIVAEEIETKELPEKKIQWVSEGVEATVFRPGDLLIGEEFNPESLLVEKGLCEKACAQLKDGEIIQFVRYGFVRKDKGLNFIWSC